LSATCQTLLDTGQLFRGHSKFRRVYNARAQIQLQNGVLRHISAYSLTSLIAPTTLKSHHNMQPSDKAIWDSAYEEEFDGLSSLPTWEIISEKQFRQLYKNVKVLPSMSILFALLSVVLNHNLVPIGNYFVVYMVYDVPPNCGMTNFALILFQWVLRTLKIRRVYLWGH